jgi:hypothetical protein
LIVRISTTQRRASVVDIQACLYGVEAEILQAEDPSDIQIELMGDPEKIAYVIGKTQSRIVTILDKVER